MRPIGAPGTRQASARFVRGVVNGASGEGIGHAIGVQGQALSHVRSKTVPASRARRRCALDRDIPAARAARETLPVSSSAARKRRCRAGVQWARSGWTVADEGVGSCCFIGQDKAEEILHWKGGGPQRGRCGPPSPISSASRRVARHVEPQRMRGSDFKNTQRLLRIHDRSGASRQAFPEEAPLPGSASPPQACRSGAMGMI